MNEACKLSIHILDTLNYKRHSRVFIKQQLPSEKHRESSQISLDILLQIREAQD